MFSHLVTVRNVAMRVRADVHVLADRKPSAWATPRTPPLQRRGSRASCDCAVCGSPWPADGRPRGLCWMVLDAAPLPPRDETPAPPAIQPLWTKRAVLPQPRHRLFIARV
jgi:hypothetical protein